MPRIFVLSLSARPLLVVVHLLGLEKESQIQSSVNLFVDIDSGEDFTEQL